MRNRGRVIYQFDIFTVTNPDSPYSRATIRLGITVNNFMFNVVILGTHTSEEQRAVIIARSLETTA